MAEIQTLTSAEVAEVLKTSVWEVTLLCRDGKLKASKPGKKWLIDPAGLRDYLDRHSNTATAVHA